MSRATEKNGYKIIKLVLNKAIILPKVRRIIVIWLASQFKLRDMDIFKFFTKKSNLSHQSGNGEVDNKRNHRLANPKKIKINLDQ